MSDPDVMTEPGILHPTLARRRFDYQRHVPVPALAAHVENFWTITWDLTGEAPYSAQVLPYPSVNASVTNTEADVTGVTRSRYVRRLTGRGYVVGARFRPGCFRPYIAHSVARLTDTHRPIAEVFGRDTRALQDDVAGTEDRTERVALLTTFLLADPPAPDPVAQEVADLVDEVARRREVIRVAHLASIAGTGIRRLERLFTEYVGAGPKWVIVRCRLQDAAARAAADDPPDWAALATELGFADQAHLTRTFSRTIGTPPAAYAASVKSHQ